MEFLSWFNTLLMLGEKRGFPINVEYADSYREYFDDGYSPGEALEEEISYADD